MKEKLIVLAGPTAAGKTALSVELAKKINGSVISADSMQVYKYMDIGSAKITKDEMQGVPHYLVDCLLPSEDFNISVFKKMADEAIEDIRSKSRIPIVCGGTGFYIRALAYDTEFVEEEHKEDIRGELEKILEEKGTVYLHDMLKEIDPESAEAIHPNNTKRVIRAIEYYRLNGSKISEHNRESRQKESPYDLSYFVLDMDRSRLYQRIDMRVESMMQAGLLDEVKKLKDMGYDRSFVSMQGLGYKELLDHLDGLTTLDEAVEIIKRDTRHFAKRQLTWFRSERDAVFLSLDEYKTREEQLNFIMEHI
jgi:tRNA dimethylallyltransferase